MKKFSGRVKLLDFRVINIICCSRKKINIFKSSFSIKVSFEGDFLSCLHQLFEIEESEIYDDYLQLRELVEIDKKFVDRSGLVIEGEGKIWILTRQISSSSGTPFSEISSDSITERIFMSRKIKKRLRIFWFSSFFLLWLLL